MNYRMIINLLGKILLASAVLMLFPMLVAVIYRENVLPFVFTLLIFVAIGAPAAYFKPKNIRIFAKEGFITVGLAWLLLSMLGAFPFVFSGAIPNYIDALFETASGFTTTGATILGEVESLPRGILFWRSLTHWVGGMGVLVFVLAILPLAGGGETIYLMRAEVPGPTKGKLVPKMRHTALILYGIYVALTALQVIALLIAGMPLYDAIVNSLATAGTGGFAVLNDSIAGYANPAAEWIIAIFMLLFGVNFNIYFFILIGNVRDALRSEELRAYLIIVALATAAVAINTAGMIEGVGNVIRTAFFQVTSIISTTGFATVDFISWPVFSKSIIILLMMLGACAGSTAGGLKISRVLILGKSIVREVRHTLRPQSVNTIRLDGEAVADETVRSAGVYMTVYVAIIALTTLLISVDGYSVETNLTAVLTSLNNIGPVLGDIGPMGNLSGYSYFSKLVLTLNMIIGRLEIMPMLILFSARTWHKR